MKKWTFSFVVLVFLISFASAAITISEPAEMYNLGDRLYIAVDGLVGSDSGNLNIQLFCGQNTSINLVKIPARAFSAEKAQSYSIPYKVLNRQDLEVKNLSTILGTCQVTANMGDQSATTPNFVISDKVSVNAKVDKISYDPGQPVKLTVDGVKANGALLEGFIQVSNTTDFLKAVVKGHVEEVISLSDTLEAGPHTLNIVVYDTGPEGILNRGEAQVNFLVNQVPTSIIASLSDEQIVPGTLLKIGAEVYDQSGREMRGTSIVRLIGPQGEESDQNLEAGEFVEFLFAQNDTAGEWKLYVIFDQLVEERTFNVMELKKAEFEIIDSVLTVTNVGNVVYDRPVKIGIGEEQRELELKIGIGESRKFNLKAPRGEYDVTVEDGDTEINRKVLLTGNAISVSDLKKGFSFGGYMIVWIFLIIILGAVGLILMKRYRKTRTLGKESSLMSGAKKVGGAVSGAIGRGVPSSVKNNMKDSIYMTSKSPQVQSLENDYGSDDKTMKDLTTKGTGLAESSLVLKGNKYPSAVVCLAISNYPTLNDNSKNELLRIIERARDSKGLIDWREDFIFLIYSPVITKTYHNESLAVKAGRSILRDLLAHNKKFNNKIQFNVGVHSGELIATKTQGKLKYTSIGNTISFSKALASSNEAKLIVSDEVRRKLLRDIKVEKSKDVGGKPSFEVSEFKNKEANEAKLKDILKRMDEKPSKK